MVTRRNLTNRLRMTQIVIFVLCSLTTTYGRYQEIFDFNGMPYDSDAQVYEVYSPRINESKRPSTDAFNSLRAKLLNDEKEYLFGSDIILSEKEEIANGIIMEAKTKEYNEGFIAPHLFKPSQHFFSVIEAIRSSELFHYIKEMPKGGALHAHDTALVNTDFLIELSYRPNLWVCKTQDLNALEMQFSRVQLPPKETCSWFLLSEVREEFGSDAVDEYLRSRFTLYPTERFLDNNEAWIEFMKIFQLLDGLVKYVPCWADYYYNALKEFYEDGVQYLEFRAVLPILYDMDGTEYQTIDTVRVYNETLTRFMNDYPDFIGSKLIYAPVRNTNTQGVDEYIKICLQIKEKYPNLVAGFDLVGQEEMGRPLRDFIPQLLSMPDDIDFFFHAGETNWFGSTVDENLIDAVLLGTKRIGHGYALLKHPLVLNQIKERDIAIEVNPISNQVLQLVSDLRNHPCAHFFAGNYPVVVSSDDPSFWKSTPLSHDFYVAFLGIASYHSDLRLLKKLALNSIKYSSMSNSEKQLATFKWEKEWDRYIEYIIASSKSSSNSLQTNQID